MGNIDSTPRTNQFSSATHVKLIKEKIKVFHGKSCKKPKIVTSCKKKDSGLYYYTIKVICKGEKDKVHIWKVKSIDKPKKEKIKLSYKKTTKKYTIETQISVSVPKKKVK